MTSDARRAALIGMVTDWLDRSERGLGSMPYFTREDIAGLLAALAPATGETRSLTHWKQRAYSAEDLLNQLRGWDMMDSPVGPYWRARIDAHFAATGETRQPLDARAHCGDGEGARGETSDPSAPPTLIELINKLLDACIVQGDTPMLRLCGICQWEWRIDNAASDPDHAPDCLVKRLKELLSAPPAQTLQPIRNEWRLDDVGALDDVVVEK